MKALLPVLAAGGTFAGAAVAGLLLGILVADRSGQPLWAVGGFFAGCLFGGYAALRLIQRAM